MLDLSELLETCAQVHRHVCPRQVLGLRMGIVAAEYLHTAMPQNDKHLLVFVETDGCLVDAISLVTGCYVGHRTMRIVDYGKVAATFVNVRTEQAVRIAPRHDIRVRANLYASDEPSRWHAQLLAYQRMPNEELLTAQPVALAISLAGLLSRPGRRAVCAICGEEVLNEREITVGGVVTCRSCAGQSYYLPTVSSNPGN